MSNFVFSCVALFCRRVKCPAVVTNPLIARNEVLCTVVSCNVLFCFAFSFFEFLHSKVSTDWCAFLCRYGLLRTVLARLEMQCSVLTVASQPLINGCSALIYNNGFCCLLFCLCFYAIFFGTSAYQRLSV